MSTGRLEDPRALHVPPAVAVCLVATGAVSLFGAWYELPRHLAGIAYGPAVALSICLIVGTFVAYQVPLNVSRHTHVYVSSVAYYLLAALVTPVLAAAAAGVGSMLGEWSVRKRTGTFWTDIVAQAGRRTLIVLAASIVAHLSGKGTEHTLLLLAAAVILYLGDMVTFPIIVYRLAKRPAHRIVISTTRQTYLVEGAQYLVAVEAALAWGHQFWALGLLAAPTALVYLAFRSSAEAQDARAAAQLAADALRESEQRYRGLFENASDIVFTVDPSGNFTSVNGVSEQILGYSEADLLHMNVSQLAPPAAGDSVLSVVKIVSETGAPATRELQVQSKSGTPITVEISSQPVFAGAELVGVQGIARDVTERRRAEEERAHQARELAVRILEAQESERKRISRELHDETAQSLSILLTNLDLLEQHVPRDAGELRAGLLRIGNLAKRVLDEVRTLSHDLRPTILDDVGLCPALEWLAREYELSYGGRVEVRADPTLSSELTPEEELALFRMAQEALTNSGKHGAAAEVSVSLSAEDACATLTVEDNGEGFDVTDVKRPSKEGHLGLYGLRERAALLNGTVSIASRPGEGTRVRVQIPLERASGQETPRALSEAR